MFWLITFLDFPGINGMANNYISVPACLEAVSIPERRDKGWREAWV
jgi:hypothetical protein